MALASRFDSLCVSLSLPLLSLFLLKLFLAPALVLADLAHPATMSPAGCVAMCISLLGSALNSPSLTAAGAALHASLLLCFLRAARRERAGVDPAWFPNTVAVSVSADKLFPFRPHLARLLLATSLVLFLFLFPASLHRVATDRSVAPTVCWIQMSAPAGLLVAFIEMCPPTSPVRSRGVVFLFLCCLLSVASVFQAVGRRWREVKATPFSPAHAAYCFPAVAHAAATAAFHEWLLETLVVGDAHPPPSGPLLLLNFVL
ncbi:hypothetical protein TeGR_g4, partial [Tetraparma gracilis]